MKTRPKQQTFPIIIEEDKTGGYIVTNPSLEGCYSQGETIEEALKNIKEATELCLLDLREKKKFYPAKNISLHLITLENKYA